MDGNADLFVKFYDSALMNNRDNWLVPSATDYNAKSVDLIRQDKLHLKAEDLKSCFTNEDSECVLVFGVYGFNYGDN